MINGALKGSAGISKHIEDFEIFKSSLIEVTDFKEEMIGMFNQKRQLGLIPCLSTDGNKNELIQFADELEMAFLIANHDQASSILRNVVSNILNYNIRFVTSNFTGYGLFKEIVFSYDQFINRYKSQI